MSVRGVHRPMANAVSQLMIGRALRTARALFALKKEITKFDHSLAPVLETAPRCGQCSVVPTTDREQYRESHQIRHKRCGDKATEDWTRSSHNRLFTEHEAVAEATRCMKCADSPCQKACSTGIDIRSFIYQIQNQNYYGAAKTILSDNPLGLSCGGLCPVSELCASTCNAHWLEKGTIQIGKLQEFACHMFKQMKVKQIRDPKLPPLPPSLAKQKIALIGAGSASLSCASFLARLGYQQVHIFQKAEKAGGLVHYEIPPNRSNLSDLQWEVSLVEDLGVKMHYGQEFGCSITEQSLRSEGFKAIFVGVGLNKPKTIFDALLPNVYTSKTFLPPVCDAVKSQKKVGFQLHGHVLVLGIGDTALDCARSALRMGAKQVSVVFRRGFDDLRANDEIFMPALFERINFISNLTPRKLIEKDGKCVGVSFTQYAKNDKGQYVETGRPLDLDCDFVISALGSQNGQAPIKAMLFQKGQLQIDRASMQHKIKKDLFAGGDVIGTNNLVDAVNDGKVASWYMHKYLSEQAGIRVPDKPQLPGFFTEIDLVDISIEMAGVKFDNPYGLASAPPTTSYPMIRRAFEEGWGFAVVKTFMLDKEAITNVSPRIFKATNNPLKSEASFSNIELVSEKKAKYWVQGAKEIKKDFPHKVLIGSIMAPYVKADWQELSRMSVDADFDILELNLSCNHGMPDKGMGRACSDDPIIVGDIVSWVKSIYKKPVFVKLSPNSSITQAIAAATKRAGGEGVSCTNTMFSLMDAQGGKTPYPAVGEKQQVYFGGATGPLIRPIALRVATNVSKAVPDIQIMATGGIISAQHAMNYLRFGGCSVFQVCSAVQEQDFAITITDMTNGLKALLYLQKRSDLAKKGWVGQSPPLERVQQLRGYSNTFKLWDQGEEAMKVDLKSVPKLKDLKGKGQSHIQLITKMDWTAQKFPVISDSLCVNCGKCYLTCLDSGYQAITFSSQTHKPEITKDCTGCGLCLAVCPVPGALQYEKRPQKYPYTPQRGDKYFQN